MVKLGICLFDKQYHVCIINIGLAQKYKCGLQYQFCPLLVFWLGTGQASRSESETRPVYLLLNIVSFKDGGCKWSKGGYAAVPVACGWVGTVFEVII